MNTLELTALIFLLTSFQVAQSQVKTINSVTVPIYLDHNRMLVDAEMQRKDGTWRKVRLWIDSGSPEFFISESLAQDLGIDISNAENPAFNSANLDIEHPKEIRIGDKKLDFEGIRSRVKFQPYWLFSTMHCDGNLPSTLLKKYHIIFDYQKLKLTVADQGVIKPQGVASTVKIHPQTGIIQMDALIEGESYNFALDIGASYSFISEAKLLKLSQSHPKWPSVTGTLGCANMWGWWPNNEQQFQVVRIPEIKWGNNILENTGIVGVTRFFPNGPTLGEWYSQKTVYPLDGFLGSNVLKNYRIEIDYANKKIYFEKYNHDSETEMDMVGISIRQMPDFSYQVVGIVNQNQKPVVSGIEPNDVIISIDDFIVAGNTMGTVVDNFRGKPDDIKKIVLNRDGVLIEVTAKVKHFL